jgi:hypothetical protein
MSYLFEKQVTPAELDMLAKKVSELVDKTKGKKK